MESSRPGTSGTDTTNERDVVPELPDNAAIAAVGAGRAFHQHQHNTQLSRSHSQSPPHSPIQSSGQDGENAADIELVRTNTRRSSTHSHVPVDFFDREGVNELKRTLTIQSVARSIPPNRGHRNGQSSGDDSTVVSEVEGPDKDNFDFEDVLRDAIRRAQESSIKPRELGVVFQDLRVQGLGTAASYQPTIGSMINPFLILERIRNVLHPPVHDILSGFEGVVSPGEMLLVLGRPGAGCSTLLKTLANQHEEYHSISGLLRFSAFTSKQIRKHFRGDVIYCPEDDIHFPTLTVEQTLDFAVRTRMPNKKARIDAMSRQQFSDMAVDTLATVFGLRHVKKTKVGNAAVRGVSGGQRKRVSIAEALATRALLSSWDNSTRGLDSSTALEFVRALRIATDNFRLTSIVSIYQASELLYELFDKVCVIYEGRMVYFGPADAARQYFIDMGFEPVNRQTTPDFLVAVTDPNGRFVREGFENRVPRTADEMASAFQRHLLAQQNKHEIAAFLAANVILDESENDELSGKCLPSIPEAPQEEKELKRVAYVQSARAEREKGARPESPYTISVASQIRETVVRRVQILYGDWLAQAINLFSYIFQAIIMGTMFLDLPNTTSSFFSRGGVLYFALLFGALSSMAEIPSLYSQRPIVHRHAKAAMYHPFTETVALSLVDIPITFVILILFSVILYFLVGLQRSADQFFIFYLLIVLQSLVMKAFYRALAAAFKQESGAMALGGVFVLAFVIYTGYTIPEPTMVGGLKWIKYINPLRYGFEAIMANEFHTIQAQCSQLVPSGSGYENATLANQVCTTVGSVTGQSTVNGSRFINLAYNYSHSHLWRDVGIMIAFCAALLVAQLVLTEINTKSAGESVVTLYKRGTKKTSANVNRATDEEKGQVKKHDALESPEVSDKVDVGATRMSDIFSWQDICYTVPIGKGETRLLLDNVSGYVVPGKVTALMGESGAGKTTLLNVLAGRTDIGIVTGDRFVNGQGLPHDFQAQTGYCQQLDTHIPEMTVREALQFSAKLRQPSSVPLAEKEAYAEMCLKMCGLQSHADAIVGTLNVEYRKRTTIGVELAAKPRLLLFLDEPTSGLDSQSSWAILQFLRSLAEHGQAILCTIHQPSSELFQMFDRLLLLQKGGQTVYFGDLGQNAATLINYFEKHGARTCEPHENPAEWMLDVIGAGATATSAVDWHDVWLKSEETAKFKTNLDEIHEEGRKRPPIEALHKSEFAMPWIYQLYALTERAFQAYWRKTTYISSKQFLNAAAGLFIGFSFYKASNTVQDTQNKLFAIFMSTIIAAAHANSLMVEYINIRSVYEIRERPSRIYSWTALVTSLLLVEIPWNIFGSALYYVCWYWTVGFENSRAGYTFLMLAVAFPLYYTSISEAVAAMSPSATIGAVLFSTLFSFVIAFCGVMQPYQLLGWWKWMYRLSPFTYFIEGVLGQALGKLPIVCSETELASLEPPSGLTCSQYMDNYIQQNGGYLANPDATSGCQFCAYRTSDQFLERSFNIFYSHRWRDFGLFLVYIAFNIVMIYVFTYIFRIRSRK